MNTCVRLQESYHFNSEGIALAIVWGNRRQALRRIQLQGPWAYLEFGAFSALKPLALNDCTEFQLRLGLAGVSKRADGRAVRSAETHVFPDVFADPAKRLAADYKSFWD